jgi:PBP1b-binding outer membrane lipoprotein LpoB
VSAGQNAALDGTDLVKMTDQMAASLAGDPDVQRAVEEHGKLVVVVQPVVNLMTAEVLPRGPAEAFTGRIRSLLANHAPDSFTWVMNRDAYYRMRDRERDFDLGPDPERVQPEYALTAKFSSLTKETRDRRSSYYLCVYELTNLQSGDILWTDRYEVKKTAVGGGILD